jgi:hypothetical protein
MSYARMSADSDVYIYHDVDGFLTCLGCALVPAEELKMVYDHWLQCTVPEGHSFECFTYSEMIAHLEKHIYAGHKVPHYCIDKLRQDMIEDNNEVKPFIKFANKV